MKLQNATPLFVGPKSERAIPVRHHLRRDFLIQSTLDANVRRIAYHPGLQVDGTIVAVDALVLDRDDGLFAVDLTDARPSCDPTGEHLLALAFAEGCTAILTVDAADVRREPRFSAARRIWRHRDVHVHSNDREQILGTLDAEGPLPLRSIPALVDTDRDPISVVFALASGLGLAAAVDLAPQSLYERTGRAVAVHRRDRFRSARRSPGT